MKIYNIILKVVLCCLLCIRRWSAYKSQNG